MAVFTKKQNFGRDWSKYEAANKQSGDGLCAHVFRNYLLIIKCM